MGHKAVAGVDRAGTGIVEHVRHILPAGNRFPGAAPIHKTRLAPARDPGPDGR